MTMPHGISQRIFRRRYRMVNEVVSPFLSSRLKKPSLMAPCLAGIVNRPNSSVAAKIRNNIASGGGILVLE